MTYKSAGVDTTKKDGIIDQIIRLSKRTYDHRVIEHPWGFAGLYSLFPKTGKTYTSSLLFTKNYKSPTLVACSDGVGTKLKIAFLLNKHNTIGIDLVAMSINDLIVIGAEPLFFLDYISIGKVDEKIIIEIIKGIVTGCEESSCALLGGETAEMPSFYPPGEYDLAGFAIGLIDKYKIITGKSIKVGDVVIGLASSGLHSNGYSLARKVLLGNLSPQKALNKLNQFIPEISSTLGEELLKPTKIYARAVKKVLQNYHLKKVVKGIAHITGGGLVENIPRILPHGVAVEINSTSYECPPIFQLIKQLGKIPQDEMYRVFNMGIGLVLIVDPFYADSIVHKLKKIQYNSYIIGQVVHKTSQFDQQVVIK
ncbi:MAG: phosphoribosylformylglycinamidine cyclo-ligase [Planctomycetota bacterium]